MNISYTVTVKHTGQINLGGWTLFFQTAEKMPNVKLNAPNI